MQIMAGVPGVRRANRKPTDRGSSERSEGIACGLPPFVLLLGASILLPAVTGCTRQKTPPPPQTPEVVVITARPESIRITSQLPGRTAAFRVAEIRPQVNGLIQKRLFEEGSDVDAGQVLYRIDPAPFQAALDSAKASLARAEAGLGSIRLRVKRYGELIAEKAISQQDYDDASAAMMQTEAEIGVWSAAVETARINLEYTSVKAPISGRIGKSSVTDGALVTAFQPVPLATIQQLDPIYVDVPQSATERLRLQGRLEAGRIHRAGPHHNKVQLILADGTPYTSEGTLQFQDVTVDPTTGSVILRTVFPNPEGVLLPGMFVRAVIVEGIDEEALLVPQQCVSRTARGEPFVLLVDADATVRQRMLTIDRAIGHRWLVASGLDSGDRVIVEGMQRARPGASVHAVPFVAEREEDPRAEESNRASSPGN